MMYNNSMKLTLKNKKVATAALEILQTRMAAGFDCDSTYRRNPSMMMHDDLELSGKTIILSEDSGSYIPEDAIGVEIELLKHLANTLTEETFSSNFYNDCDCSASKLDAKYENGVLKIKSVYYPNGYCECLTCDDCGSDIICLDEFEEGMTYICPECGEEVDLSEAYEEYKSIVEEIILNIK